MNLKRRKYLFELLFSVAWRHQKKGAEECLRKHMYLYLSTYKLTTYKLTGEP